MKIYTDGAYKPTTDQGGWAFVTDDGFTDWNGVKNTTNNRMEIQGVLEAMKYIIKNNIKDAEIYSDSQYVICTITKGWKKKMNTDLWEEFEKLISQIDSISFMWVKGHSVDKLNNKADELAVKGSELYLVD
jgi:ribonuclease HI